MSNSDMGIVTRVDLKHIVLNVKLKNVEVCRDEYVFHYLTRLTRFVIAKFVD